MLKELHVHLFLYLLLLLSYIHTDNSNLFIFHVMHLGYYSSVLRDKTIRRHCVDIYIYIYMKSIHSFIPPACAECDDSLPFSGNTSIPLCYIPFPSTLFHQLAFHPSSLHLAIYFLFYLSALLFPNSYLILFLGILFSSILCTCPDQRNLFKLIVSVIVFFLTIA